MYTQSDIDKFSWFHGLDFGNGLKAKGRSTPENWSLFGALTYLEEVPLSGTSFLDVGTMDDLVSLIAEHEGADRIVATDLYDRESMRAGLKIADSKIEYHPRTSIEDLLEKFGRASFDVVVMGGLLYHLVSPLRAILIGRSLLKTGGVLVLETVATEQNKPTLQFNLGEPVIDEYTSYFVPSLMAVREMMRFCNFSILGSNKVRPDATRNYIRGTVFGRAVDPSNVEASTDLMARAQLRASRSANDRILDEFNFAKFKDSPLSVLSNIEIPKSGDDLEINKFEFTTRFKHQPK